LLVLHAVALSDPVSFDRDIVLNNPLPSPFNPKQDDDFSEPSTANEPGESHAPTTRHSGDGSDVRASAALHGISGVDALLLRGKSNEELDFGDRAEEAPRISLNRQQELEQKIKNSPADTEPYLELANLYRQSRRLKDARRITEKGVNVNPECDALHELNEDIELEIRHAALLRATEVCAKSPTLLSKKSLKQCELDMANSRARTCEVRLQRDPQRIELMVPWAIALRQLNRHDDAIEKLSEAVAIRTIRARAALQLGMCHQQAGHVLAALSAYRKAAFSRSPEPPMSVRHRALDLAADLAESSGLLDSAIGYLNERMSTEPVENSEQIALLKGRIATLTEVFRENP
jgi:tetratricopeptide (TPR) repeat protein